MKYVTKRLLVLLAVLLLFCCGTGAAHAAYADDYKGWSMYDERWASTALGDPAREVTVAVNGSHSVALTKLMLQAGIRNPEEFDVKDFVALVNNQGGYQPDGSLWEEIPTSALPGFHLTAWLDVPENIPRWVRDGYHVAIQVSQNGTVWWMAVDESRTLEHNETYVMDCRSTDPDENVNLRWRDLEQELEGLEVLEIQGYVGGSTEDVCWCTPEWAGSYRYVRPDPTAPGLPIYAGHGAGYEQLGSIPVGEVFQADRGWDYCPSMGYVWLHVNYNGISGCVSREYRVEQVSGFVTYHANGGKHAPEPQEWTAEEGVTLSGQRPTRPGYTFLGWAADPDDPQEIYHPGDTCFPGSSLVLYALWEQTPPERPYKIVNVVNGIHIYWNEVDGAEKYGLWRSETGKDGDYLWLGNPTLTHFTDTTAESGKTYFYKVTSVINRIHSQTSDALGIVFVSTPDIAKRENTAAGIKLDWEPVSGASGYAIYRKHYDGEDAWARVATVEGGDTLTWTDTEVKNSVGSVYKYTIRALAGKNLSTLSGCRAAGRTMVRLSSQYIKNAQQISDTAVKCTWSTTKAATGYEVRFMAGDQVYRTFTIGNYKTGVKTFTGLEAGQEYTVQVRAYKKVDGVGSFYSPWSAPKIVTG